MTRQGSGLFDPRDGGRQMVDGRREVVFPLSKFAADRAHRGRTDLAVMRAHRATALTRSCLQSSPPLFISDVQEIVDSDFGFPKDGSQSAFGHVPRMVR